MGNRPTRKDAKVILFTDGSCRKTKKSGWAVVVVVNNNVIDRFSGAEHPSTNNRAELIAVIEAILYANGRDCEIISDSKYVIDGIRGWMVDWARCGWKNFKGKEIKNRDLWEDAHALVTNYPGRIKFSWIKSHQGLATVDSAYNTLADKLASEASR